MYPLDLPEYNADNNEIKEENGNPEYLMTASRPKSNNVDKELPEKKQKIKCKSTIIKNSVIGETDEDIKNKCLDAYNYRSLTPRYMVGYCDLSNNKYLIDDKDPNCPDNIYGIRVRSQSYIFISPLGGMIMCHPDYEYRMKYVEAFKELIEQISCHHNLQNKTLKHRRSSGKMQEIKIPEECPLRVFKNGKLGMSINLDEQYSKNIYLEDLTIDNNGEEYTNYGWINTNKEFFNKDFTLEIGFVKLDVDWLNTERQKIISIFTESLKKVSNREFKFKFYEYDSGY